jgi:hypothetical protein
VLGAVGVFIFGLGLSLSIFAGPWYVSLMGVIGMVLLLIEYKG